MDSLKGHGGQDDDREEGIEFSNVDSNDSDDNEQLSDDERRKLILWLKFLLFLGQALALYIKMIECFQPIEMTRGSQSTIIHHMPVRNQLGRSIENAPHFKELTNFTVEEFHELCVAFCPFIVAHARCTSVGHKLPGRPYKLTPKQQVLSFVMYMKWDNIIYLDANIWNWARSALYDNAIFLASCVNEALVIEIQWPNIEERLEREQRIPLLRGCLGFIDNTLVRVLRPFENPLHKKCFQGRKKMYCMNNGVVVDHDGLFRFVDGGYPRSYHDVLISKHSWVDGNWRDLFVNREGYCEYLLGDIGYKGMERYVIRGFSIVEIQMMNLPLGLVKEFNQMHNGYRVAVEWGIGGLKQKWRRMMKRFDITRQKVATTFRVAAIMTNFIHRRQRDMQSCTIGPTLNGLENRGWAGDY